VPPENRNDRSACSDPDGVGPRLFFQKVPEGKVVKNRLHLDLRAAVGASPDERMPRLEAECARLVAIGATRVQRIEGNAMDGGIIVMQDPEGNEFCLD
ncbi:MAG TPA: VOC family protein, partial [Marmoricola sp.]|nr:VOC family protein [Marmoricola sp.]